jgi:predicted dinucleotide-binding enzyme
MTTLGLIGAGHIGGTIARLAVAAGHEVVLSSSRGPETLADLVAELGPRARAAMPAEAAAAGDLVVVTIPLKNTGRLPFAALAGKTVIDTNNYYPSRDGRIAELDEESTTTSERLQALLPTAHVVKAFNNINFRRLAVLARPSGSADRSALPLASDSASAKADVTAFFDSIGYDTVDAGTLADSWRFQRDTPVYGTPYAAGPAGVEEVRALLAQATRPAPAHEG